MKYLRYVFRNIEPLRIADDYSSQSGQTNTLTYIPGSTIRGYVINRLASCPDFEDIKLSLFSDRTCFMNAYISENGKDLIPSPKGFYEDKTTVKGKKKIQNVVLTGSFEAGMKRAALGRYCYFDGDCIYYYSVSTGSDMKITINKGERQNVFRNEYILAGNTFTGFIAVEDDLIAERIAEVLQGTVILGNARSQGLGKCQIISSEFLEGKQAYSDYAVKKSASGCLYMILVSAAVMRNEAGEYAGLNLASLEKMLGVSNLAIEYCATSTVNVKGYNRAWGVKIPSVPMYEAGSVFKLTFDGTAEIDRINSIMNLGIGVRRNEGFGRVIFIDDYEKIVNKLEGSRETVSHADVEAKPEDRETISLVARNYYRHIVENSMKESKAAFPRIKSSQVGTVRRLLEANRYDALKGTKIVHDYFEHAYDKEQSTNIHKDRVSIAPFMKFILDILDEPLAATLKIEDIKTVMTIPVAELFTEDELQRLKFDYLLMLMQEKNRREA